MRASAAARLDRLPIGPFHRKMLMLIGAGMFFDSFDIYLTGTVLGALMKSGWSTLSLNASFVSATFVGMVIGALGAGILGDRFGRKFTYQFNLGIFGLASLAAAVMPDMHWLIGARFVTGIGLGAEIVIGYATMIEFVPPQARGRWSAGLSLLTNFGLFAATLAGYFIIPTIGWRYMFALAGVGALFVLWLRRAIPESPRWLETHGRADEADAMLTEVEAGYGPLPAPEMTPLPPAPSLVSRGMLGRLGLGSLLNVVMGIAIYGFVVWVPTILVQHGLSLNRSLGQSVLMSLGGPTGALIGVLLADRLGRRRAIIGASLLGCVVGTLFAQSSSQEMAVVLGFAMFTLIYFLVAVAIANYVPELFPTATRMRGNGICSTIGRLTTIIVPQIAIALFQVGGVVAVLGGVAVALATQAVVVWLAGIETNQRSLESIAP